LLFKMENFANVLNHKNSRIILIGKSWKSSLGIDVLQNQQKKIKWIDQTNCKVTNGKHIDKNSWGNYITMGISFFIIIRKRCINKKIET
jgi:hypothetical protein